MSAGDGSRSAERRIVVDGQEVPIRVRRSSRARRVRLVVRPAEPLEVILPRRATLGEVDPFLVENRRWLRDKLAWARALAERPPPFDLDRPGVVWIAGRPLPVLLQPAGRSRAVSIDGAVRVSGPAPASAVDRWYRREARRILSAEAEHQAFRLGLPYRSVSIRDQRTRWGSCSPSGDLSFSWRLLLAPPSVLRYVVVHELCHLQNANHGARFRRALDLARPGWREEDRWLAEYGHDLRRYRPRIFGTTEPCSTPVNR
jgi:predicted metal-dependent hydrolase